MAGRRKSAKPKRGAKASAKPPAKPPARSPTRSAAKPAPGLAPLAALDAMAMARLRVALELEIPSDVRYIESVVSIVARHCAQFQYGARQTSLNIPVALTEALSNAILRGNGERDGPRVQVKADVTPARLVLEVVDEGSGFDLAECLLDPTSPENLEREDGRGLFLMTRLMDRLERFSSHGNVVRMTLHRHD